MRVRVLMWRRATPAAAGSGLPRAGSKSADWVKVKLRPGTLGRKAFIWVAPDTTLETVRLLAKVRAGGWALGRKEVVVRSFCGSQVGGLEAELRLLRYLHVRVPPSPPPPHTHTHAQPCHRSARQGSLADVLRLLCHGGTEGPLAVAPRASTHKCSFFQPG